MRALIERRRRVIALGALVAAGIWLARPTPASAHALLIASTPPAGQILGTPPGTVDLEFSEPLNPQSSTAAVVDPGGHRWSAQIVTGQEVRIPLATNAAGVYEVDWSTTSLGDGHHTSGAIRFGVRVAAATLSTAAAPNTQPQPTDLLLGVVKWVEALALLALLGQLLIATLANRPPALAWGRVRYWLAAVALSAGLVAVWGEVTSATGGHSAPAELTYFTSSVGGIARLVRVGAEALAVGAAVRGSRWLWLWTAAALSGVAASGHANDVQPAAVGVLLDSVHLVAAGLWAGGIIALATQRPPSGWRSSEALELLRRFTPVALVSFSVTVVVGALQAVLQLGSPAALISTTYGAVLIAKILLVGSMLPLSWFAWRRRRPRLRVEASIAATVVAAAALLSAFPAPPSVAADEAAASATTLSTAGIPAPHDLTMAGHAGTVLVGLSVQPARPGRNRVLVYLLPPQGGAAAAVLVANISGAAPARRLVSCGSTCRQTNLVLQGGEMLRVDVLNPGGGEATFTLPSLPALAGDSLVSGMQRAMHQLHSYAVNETLSSGRTTIASTYASVAPDRSTFTVNGTSTTVWIGTTEYSRSGPDQPWAVSRDLARNVVPSYVWDYFRPLTNAHVLGRDVVDGVPTTMVAAFGNRQSTAIWFTFWIDDSGLVRQVQMLAAGHFMIDHFLSVNQPAQITAPV